MATSEAQKRASSAYKKRNAEKNRYMSAKGASKGFTTIDERQEVDKEKYLNDLKEIKKLFEEKIEKLEK